MRIKKKNKYLCILIFVVTLFSCAASRKGNGQAMVSSPIDEQTNIQETAKRLSREGYKTMIGRLPLEEQLAEAWKYQREKDIEGNLRYFVTSARSKAGNFNAARMQAESLAKVQLAGLIETRIGQLISNKVEVSESDKDKSDLNTIGSSKNLVTTRLSNLVPLLEIYKDFENGSVEVQIVICCKSEWANEIANKLVNDSMQ